MKTFIFSFHSGFITSRDLREVMASLGESLTDEEVNQMISMTAAADSNGRIAYQDFVKLMSSK